ncbi:MAG: N-acetylmuramoyl-L-alanine amidase [bacterium]|nr:N-acetylmuramoyl-L-alanine amidase [bacterium]
MIAIRLARILAVLSLTALLLLPPTGGGTPGTRAQSVGKTGDTATPAELTPALSVEALEFLPGQGRASRSFLLYRFGDNNESYLDLWDATQILKASRFFDPITRKVVLGVDGHRVKLIDGSHWAFYDGRARHLGGRCRIAGGRFYLPLTFWPVLLDEFPELPLRLDPNALRLVGGLRAVNVHSVDWIFQGELLRGVFQLSEPLTPTVERLSDSALRLSFDDGRFADFNWRRVPGRAPLDSLRLLPRKDGVDIELYFHRALGQVRSAGDAEALTWALTMELPADPGLAEPDFERELVERLPGDIPESDRVLRRIILDPGHGGADTGAVAGRQMEKDWNLRIASRLESFLIEEGFQVLWTRREDRERRASDRVQAANVARGDLYLSLHFTRRGATGAPGLEIMIQEADRSLRGKESLIPWESAQGEHLESSLELAVGLQRALDVLTEWPQQGIRRENTATLEGLDMPALLLELGNLDSASDRAAWDDRIVRDKRLKILAQALAYRARQWGGER